MQINLNRSIIPEPWSLVMDYAAGKEQCQNQHRYFILTQGNCYRRSSIQPTIRSPHNHENSKLSKDPILDRPQHLDRKMDLLSRTTHSYGGL